MTHVILVPRAQTLILNEKYCHYGELRSQNQYTVTVDRDLAKTSRVSVSLGPNVKLIGGPCAASTGSHQT